MSKNKNDYGYGREKLFLAVNSLATGTGSIQERLENVAIGWLGLPSSFPDLLPADLMPELKAILDELTKVQGEEGAIRATARAISDEEGAELAGRVLSLYINLRGGI
jgi:hypothetical protein